MPFKWCGDITFRAVNIPGDIRAKIVDDFKTGILIERFVAYLNTFKKLTTMFMDSQGMKPFDNSIPDINSPLYTFRHITCGLKPPKIVGELSGEPHMFFKPYLNTDACDYLSTTVSATVICCKIYDCKECINIARKHIEKYLKNKIDYNVEITFSNISKNSFKLCIEVK